MSSLRDIPEATKGRNLIPVLFFQCIRYNVLIIYFSLYLIFFQKNKKFCNYLLIPGRVYARISLSNERELKCQGRISV